MDKSEGTRGKRHELCDDDLGMLAIGNIDQTTNDHRPSMVKRALDSWLLDLRPNMMLTFTFHYAVKPIVAHARMDRFFNKILRRHYGLEWRDLAHADEFQVVGFFERPETNAHYHVLIHAKLSLGMKLFKCGKKTWRNVLSRGGLEIQMFTDSRRVAPYAAKKSYTRAAQEAFYVYSPNKAGR